MRVTGTTLAALLAAVALTACGGGGGTEVPEPSTDGFVTYEFDGVSYPASVYECAQAVWDARIEEWNELTLDRDARGLPNVVDGGREYADFETWAAARGYELTIEETVPVAAAGECAE